MPVLPSSCPERVIRLATAAVLGLALAVLALLAPTPSTADHVLLADPARAAKTWAAGW